MEHLVQFQIVIYYKKFKDWLTFLNHLILDAS